MPDYGEAKYWDNRYLQESSEPFDWLLDYNNVEKIIDFLISKEHTILMIGCGNAPFSADMYHNGYTKIINIDISPVVINQQKERFPEMSWLVMNVHKIQYPNESFPVIIDKSLLDTVLCYNNSIKWSLDMISEIYRVLSPGGIYITFSLHFHQDIIHYFKNAVFKWRVTAFRVRNHRWDEESNSRRNVAHTMIICEKPADDGGYRTDFSSSLPGVLSEEEHNQLEEYSVRVNSNKFISNASTASLLRFLDKALSATFKTT